MATLELSGVEMDFAGHRVLRGIDLRVGRGETLWITGPNGAGKSTLLRIAAGLLRPTRGRARVAEVAAVRARTRGWIGWCGEPGFTRRLSLRVNLEAAGRLGGLGGRPLARRIAALAERIGFDDHLDVPAERCSTGLRQRAALARALLHDPRVLLLDEPLRGVDADSAQQLAGVLREAASETALLWVGHAAAEHSWLGGRALRLPGGRVRAPAPSAIAT